MTGWLVFDRSDSDDARNNLTLRVTIASETQELQFSELIE